jgi:uncharacterized membrane protein
MARQQTSRMPLVSAFAARPRLLIALAIGLAVFLALLLIRDMASATRALLGWDAACLVFLLSILPLMRATDVAAIRSNAATQDEGQWVILALAIVAAAASILAVGLELSVARNSDGWVKALRIGLAFATVALSWTFVQFVFALHYAHEYYGPKATAQSSKGGGLAFPGGEPPDYWDFLHFAVVIGVACQTADVAFTSKPLRRIGSIHGVLAFAFNTGVLALTVNLLAGLFGSGG